MSTSAIQSVLQEMQSLASQGVGDNVRGQYVATTVGKAGFAQELHASIERINALQNSAGEQIKAFEAGSTGVALNDVMVDAQKASLAFDMGVQVRNRLLTAYKEVMNMQI